MDLLIDSTSNLVYTQTGLTTVTEPDACLLQTLATRLRLLQGEYTLDDTQGVDWTLDDLSTLLTTEVTKDGRVAYIEYHRTGSRGDVVVTLGVKNRSS